MRYVIECVIYLSLIVIVCVVIWRALGVRMSVITMLVSVIVFIAVKQEEPKIEPKIDVNLETDLMHYALNNRPLRENKNADWGK